MLNALIVFFMQRSHTHSSFPRSFHTHCLSFRSHYSHQFLHAVRINTLPKPTPTLPYHRQNTQLRRSSPITPASATFSSSSNASSTDNDNDNDLPFSVYTALANSDYWHRRPVSVTKRTLEVSTTFGQWILSGKLRPNQSRENRADELRRILTNLGPAYVKIGQAISSRPDVVPPEFLTELEKLQDRLPPFPTEEALQVMAVELGRSPYEIFSSISPTPIAAASLGQVYKGTLKSDGSQVAIKVQRPGVAASIALDIYVLRYLTVALRKWRKLNTDLPALLDEWAASLFRELDYRVEAANGTKFKQLYGRLEGVYVPKMYENLTTTRVLVMEWIDGERLRSAADGGSGSGTSTRAGFSTFTDSEGKRSIRSSKDDLRLVEVGVRCSLEQMLEEGFYHADPHPGNLLRTKDGKLAYLDFGMMGQVDESIRRGLLRATLHLVNREYDALADDFVTLGMLPKDSEKAKVVPALTGVFAEALKGGVNNLSFGDLSGNLGRTMYQFKFQIPSYYTLLVRSLSVLEGIALASNPSYKVLSSAYPWIARRLLTDTSPELRTTLTALLYKDNRFNFKRMESLLVQAVRSPTSGFVEDDPSNQERPQFTKTNDAVALLLSPEASFVRGVVVEELAKGVDAAWRLAADSVLDTSTDTLKKATGSNTDTHTTTGGGFSTAGFPPPLFDSSSSRIPLPPGVGLLLGALLELLLAAPKLANSEDAAQVEGLKSLAVALKAATPVAAGSSGTTTNNNNNVASLNGNSTSSSSSTNSTSSNTSTTPESCTTELLQSIETAASVLQWLAKELDTLTPEQRNEAFKLPIEVAQASGSRAVARLLRWLVAGQGVSPTSSGGRSAAAGRTASSGSGRNTI